jgi:tRNA (guanine-N7-)-methyltransferase
MRYHCHGGGDIWLDLGCGKGEFFAGLAERNPDVFFIGVELRGKIAETYFPKYEHLPNLALLHGNVNLSVPSMMDHRKVQKVFLHFPDPYTRKDRYKKRRMVSRDLVRGICKILAPGGMTSVKTDDKLLFNEMDVLLSEDLDPVATREVQQEEAEVLSEWENECLRKSIPIYSMKYRSKI